jgi:hypothetical protein
MAAASTNQPTAMIASLGTRTKTSPSTGPDDHNTHNRTRRSRSSAMIGRLARAKIPVVRLANVGIEGRHGDL